MALAKSQSVPDGQHFGPVIVDETAGRPYDENRCQQEWRKVANADGVPQGVFNMDATAGGATEAKDAGANRSDVQPMMGHADPKTTTRYVRRDALAPGRRVATLRVARRARPRS
jgi:integrase